MSAFTHRIAPEEAGRRLDAFLQGLQEGTSRTEVQRWISAGLVRVNGEPAIKSLKLETDDEIIVDSIPERPGSVLEPEDIPLDIVYQDDDLLVLNKPRGLVVHPGSGVHKGTLAAALLHHFGTLSQVNGPLRPGIVHRLDKDTAGLMIVARHDAAHAQLARQLEAREIHRTYQALVWGHPRAREGRVEASIGRDSANRTRMSVRGDGRTAATRWTALEIFRFATLLELELETGRTHQIRVHMHHEGCPVVGDPVYEGREIAVARLPPLERPHAHRLLDLSAAQQLQAVHLAFAHPADGRPMEFSIPLEPGFCVALEYLRTHASEAVPELAEFLPPEQGSWAVPDVEPEPEEEDDSAFPEIAERPTRRQRLEATKIRREAKKARLAAIARGEPDPRKVSNEDLDDDV